MTTITATPNPATGAVALTITPSSTVTQVLRSDANGTVPVRTQAGVLPSSVPFAIVDNEAALHGTITYTVTDAVAGASTSTALDVPGAWLTVPVTPAVSVPLSEVGYTGYTQSRTSATVVHAIIDREDQPVTLGPLHLRAGTFDAWCPDHPTARTLEAVYASGEVVMLRQDIPGVDMYHVATQTSLSPAVVGMSPWILSVTFQEVAWPSGDQEGSLGWSVDDVTALGTTVAGLALMFPTVNDLTIGPLP